MPEETSEDTSNSSSLPSTTSTIKDAKFERRNRQSVFKYAIDTNDKELKVDDLVQFSTKQGWMNIGISIPNYYMDLSLPKPSNDYTQLDMACVNGQLNVVQDIVSKCSPSDISIEMSDCSKRTPLYHACVNGHLSIVEYLVIEGHYDPASCKDEYGVTLLHDVCKVGHLDVLRFLVKDGCVPTHTCRYGTQPFHYACSRGDMAIVEFLIAYCNPLCTDKRGITPLHVACAKGHFEVVQCLLSKCSISFNGPSVLTDEDHANLMHYAAISNNITLFQFLISNCNGDPMSTPIKK